MQYDDSEDAGYYLQEALSAAGISSHLEGHLQANAIWVTVDAEPGEIRIGNANCQVGYPPSQHGGWVAERVHDVAQGVTSMLYTVGIRDFAADTAAVVKAVGDYLNDPTPWQDAVDYDAACGPYITAGEHLRRALRAAGLAAENFVSAAPAPEPAYVTVFLGGGYRGAVLLSADQHGVDHHPDEHPGWTAVFDLTSTWRPGRSTSIPIASAGDFAADTAAAFRAVRDFRADLDRSFGEGR
jgi:hypothetical protein